MSIDIKKLKYVYSAGTPFEHTALKCIDISINDGEFVGIIGRTGCGKTTLIQLIGGLLRPTEGTVVIDGDDIYSKSADKKALRRKLGMVFQYPEYQLFEETVEKDIAFGPTKIGVPEEEIQERVREAMELADIDYDFYKDKSPFELSGGQKRRVAIAGVLAMRPRILIMDEPIAGLDPIGREALMELVKKLNDAGTTIIMISHNMDNLAEYASRIIAMKDGEVFADGTPEEVFSRHYELLDAGIGIPEAARTVMLLNERGKNVPTNIITLAQLGEYLKGRL